ncbi:hypothetical protein SDC9_59441 [bioreactor metagenome]|uniref:Methyltransferase type 11 domain-containing protein n=1 Tax=bioreactor metagenome TaxID=1076179 RepID=A0A644XA54_9ZZZZ
MDEKQSAQISRESINEEFSNKIGRLTKSKAYLDFCEEVYGYRTYLFNMMDKEQLDFIMNSVPLSSDDTLLDMGCGLGSILRLLVAKYGCRGVGIDQLKSDVTDRNGITYINGDIDQISGYHLTPTVTLSIDSLYFSKDIDKLLRQAYDFEGNRMYLFYSQYLFDETAGDRSTLQGDHTKVADILNKNKISYKTTDYSDNERLLYKKSLAALKKRKKAFSEEGNADLYEGKLKEDTMGKHLYDKGLASRYLYIIERTDASGPISTRLY